VNDNSSHHASEQTLARKIAALFSEFPQVQAVALAGSQTAGMFDSTSDIDLYVYTIAEIPFRQRAALVEKSKATRADLDLRFWDLGDEWFDAATGIEVDIIYWDTAWIETQLERVQGKHQASMGYTTCFWHTIRNSQVLYDRTGWFQSLEEKAGQPYPAELRRTIIALNHPVLRRVIPSYTHQIEKAVQRADLVSVNHRVASLLASYFDVLFAINCLLNPGEKRLLTFAAERCAKVPPRMADQVKDVLQAAAVPGQNLLVKVDLLIDGLDHLLLEEGFDPKTSQPMT
jgi:predicted nucleotidyltransferase